MIVHWKNMRCFLFFGRINYAWKDRYLLEVNLRYDGSSRFADGHRWGLSRQFLQVENLEEDFWKNAAVSSCS